MSGQAISEMPKVFFQLILAKVCMLFSMTMTPFGRDMSQSKLVRTLSSSNALSAGKKNRTPIRGLTDPGRSRSSCPRRDVSR